ncbi:hypothetical protein F5884DRAFT_295204 [Xylogone sp. PMI_703]|nr:hypothetical protein F5884DRAFT_295204 [Xylogone sp. PMI_703]
MGASEQDLREIIDLTPREATAVYIARQTKGPCIGKEAIVKLRMELPNVSSSRVTPKVLSSRVTPKEMPKLEDPDSLAPSTTREARCLYYLTKAGCKSCPKFLGWYGLIQTEDMPLPGGYLVWLFMEKVPGVTPRNFWQMSEEEREQIRKAFHEALVDVYSCGVVPQDEAIRNLVWDRENCKCYIVDYEDYELGGKEKLQDKQWMNRAKFRWQLDRLR